MDLSILNENQVAGVTATSKYTRIVAGAGSGKTRVLTYRIAYLLENNLASYEGILGITFTNKAASEIKSRVTSLIHATYNMSLCTIHSWCARFLRKECHHINYPKNFVILDEDDSKKVVKDIFVSLNRPKNDPLIKKCYGWICNKKMNGFQYKDIKDMFCLNYEIKFFLDVFRLYSEKLESMHAFDFDDLLLKTIEILKNESNGVANFYRSIITHILVDEFQDINDVQFELITLLMNNNTELYVVGDPDQTIYTWRGANNDIMINLKKSLENLFGNVDVETIILNKNYRSTKKILDSANKLIANNKDRLKKDLVSMQNDGDNISVFSSDKAEYEASYVVNTIKDLFANNIPYKNIAILYRTNYLSRELETQLNLKGIPYKIYGGMKFFQRKEIKDLISYFTLLVNSDADNCFERIINVPKRNIGDVTLDKIKSSAYSNGQSIYYYLLENDDIPLKGSKKALIKSLMKVFEDTKNRILNADYSEIPSIIEKFIIDIDYERELNDDLDTKDERNENIQELLSSLNTYFNSVSNPTFDEFIENCTLQSSQDEVTNNGDFVSLMTIHTAKGLEFDYVFIYGFNDGIIPSRRAVEESIHGLEEERRLAYVAITRAKKKLYISYNKEYSYVQAEKLYPSRFIKEAGLKTGVEVKSGFSSENTWTQIRKHNSEKYVDNTKKAVVIPKTNGVTNWQVGDKLTHEMFGLGTVKEVKDNRIVVAFDNEVYGQKTLLSSYYMIKKLYN